MWLIVAVYQRIFLAISGDPPPETVLIAATGPSAGHFAEGTRHPIAFTLQAACLRNVTGKGYVLVMASTGLEHVGTVVKIL